jgi:hypothetical protein
MFTNRTVFILGAGASWHYGYPTGEELVKKVMKRCELAEKFFDSSLQSVNQHRLAYLKDKGFGESIKPVLDKEWRFASDECKQLREKLKQVDPLVIDYFLGQNPQLQSIGDGQINLCHHIVLSKDKLSKQVGTTRRARATFTTLWRLISMRSRIDSCCRAPFSVGEFESNGLRLSKLMYDPTSSDQLMEDQIMTLMKSLTFTTVPKPGANPTHDRRAKIIERLEEQKLLLNDPAYKRTIGEEGRRTNRRRKATASVAMVASNIEWHLRVLRSRRIQAVGIREGQDGHRDSVTRQAALCHRYADHRCLKWRA